MTAKPIQLAADALHEARRTRTPIARVSETFGIAGLEAAYAVAAANTRRALAEGRVLSGKKIGLTSRAVQQQLGVDQPDFGVLFADMEYVSGAEIPASALIQPKAEGEIAFVIGRDLDEAPTWGRFLRAVEYALPAIEIVDSAIADWRITLVDTVADNASCGLYVLGTDPRRITDLALADCAMRFTRNGEPASEGSGAACLGHPLHAAWWLARTLLALGEPLRAGDVVLSGALGPMFALARGDALHLEVDGLGKVQCRAD
ncbi:2-keto-4-pentenoate hydratase [Cupriavidus sp. USMAA2-4]|uniref:2-keto-4-pentenoate hydratase n=1 Tax=Cupriavidus malaysiensis TaxID=367825 RepID=A0A1D9IE82_9BURK|nr:MULTISPECIES: fumarylacetoacetate hydrolase family protein [Cupriavidus]AOY94841.1 2-keto-4-pentenoate hydratase [Cupriavidus sp. USMAA2-4]AOZ02295.1 2-keto-4-pentenoate hydratase [Cupriavidus sp. USMAHM13]AOZ10325.1 2-keto-4-pentenoate hydratase [Cupriavidus malaysiensis]